MRPEPPPPGAVDFTAAALLFDSDGVLVDSHQAVEAAWTRWAELFDLDPVAVVTHVQGRTARQTVANFLSEPLWQKGVAIIDQLERDSADRVRAMPGALECVSALDRGRWAVVTSGTTEVALARLTAAGIPVPPVVVTAGDVRQGKPSAAPYLLAADRLQIAARECLVFEDAPAGVTAARAAGVRHVIGVGSSTAVLDVDACVQDLLQVRLEPGHVRVVGPHAGPTP